MAGYATSVANPWFVVCVFPVLWGCVTGFDGVMALRL